MAKTIQVWFDFASTYSYPAALRATQLATANHISLHWRPFMLGVIFKQQGWNDSAFQSLPPERAIHVAGYGKVVRSTGHPLS